MAEDTGADRNEDATPKRVADAREKGDVPRSRELNIVLMLSASLIGFAVMSGTAVQAYEKLTITQWQIDRETIFTDEGILNALLQALDNALWISAPFLALMFFAGFIGPLVMGGWVFSTSSIKIDLKKMSPISGIKRLFGVQGLAELFKAILKVAILGWLSVFLFSLYIDDYIRLGSLPLNEAISGMFRIIFAILLVLILSLSVVALVDIPYQKWSFAKKLRMTFQEVREEGKEMNGNPEVKNKIRQLQMANANRKMLLDVPDADVIIVNPTHYSVALRYDEELVAPLVVAKGVDEMALKIREIGNKHNVQVFSSPQLARALYRHSEIGETIPSELYLAVAQILAYVLQVKEASFNDRRRLIAPEEVPIPEQFRDKED